ncbi:uncharacterized protein LOC125531677 [Triticum urartu]|uniref:uncharacterized protein LOC125531677 n=1 Tax=Triticum urartu TaxID=4572 RepID=UPI00204353E3|nr:uncharacterized protein LOC125531677 [Triticum urartu]
MKMPKLIRKLQPKILTSGYFPFSLPLSRASALHTAAAPQPRRYDGACSPGRRLVSPNLDIVRGGAGTARPRRCLLCVMRSATIASTPTGQGARGVWGFVFPTQAKTLLEPWRPGVSLTSVFPLWTHTRLRSWLVVEESIARINQRKDAHKSLRQRWRSGRARDYGSRA